MEKQIGSHRPADPDLKKLSRVCPGRLKQEGLIERVSRGVPLFPERIADEMFTFQHRYQKSTFSHETVLFQNNLSNRNPLVYSDTVPVDYHAESLNGRDCCFNISEYIYPHKAKVDLFSDGHGYQDDHGHGYHIPGPSDIMTIGLNDFTNPCTQSFRHYWFFQLTAGHPAGHPAQRPGRLWMSDWHR